MRDKGYYGFASRAAYEAYYSGPLPKWETDAMAAYVHETEQERAMNDHDRVNTAIGRFVAATEAARNELIDFMRKQESEIARLKSAQDKRDG
jgi:hypothetical protein